MTTYLYVSLQDDDRIARFVIDPQNGALEPSGSTDVAGGPAPLAISPSRRTLYVGQREDQVMSAWSVDPATGELASMGSVPLAGEPCQIATDRAGRFLLSAYYQAGRCAVHALGAEGAVIDPAVESFETGSGAHCFQTDPSNRFSFLPHIATGSGGLPLLAEGRREGPNTIMQFHFDAKSGQLSANEPDRIDAPPGAGPRHFCFHPSRDLVYVSNEQASSVSVYALDPDAGTLSLLDTQSTLPADFEGRNSCAQIQISPSGRALYVGNRGHNSIASFALDEASGAIESTGWAEADAVPRAFHLDPSGRFLYAAGLETGTLVSYAVDTDSGRLTRLATYEVGAKPMWVLPVELG